ncbi:MAG TPA: TadE/TadG family type IV pilus assembly protein [Urbifossiella sp.]|jgi:Flp pilus assembly protein TadG|nr:TadE/TadG family type IV pilus assembly protein [Urbifossiella sp.]
MRLTRRSAVRRKGSTLVESALVIAIFLLFLFGIFEYCRFLMVLHVTNNAARDTARYASVNVNCPTSQVATMQTTIQAYATARMAGVDRNIQGYQVAVYSCDPSGFSTSPPTVVAKSSPTGTTVNPFQAYNASTNPLAAWNAAAFTDRIAVTIKGTYRPIAPLSINIGRLQLSIIPDNIPINVTAVSGSEG